MKFGILSDILGERDDIPNIKLPGGYACKDSEWVFFQDGVMRRIRGRDRQFQDASGNSVRTPDTYPILRYHYHVTSGGTEYCLAFTKAHVYRWEGGSKVWDLLWTCGGDCTRWSTADFGKWVVATNNVDKVIYWDDSTPTIDFIVLGVTDTGIDCGDGVWLTKAEYVIECESYLWLMATTESGTTRPNRRRSCSRGDLTDWDSSATKVGDAIYNDLAANARIKGCGIYTAGAATRLITFTQKLANAMWLTDTVLVWAGETILQGVGCAAPDSIVNDGDGNLYYLATDHTIRQLGSEKPITEGMAATVRNLHPQLLHYAQGVSVPDLGQLWWAVPKGPTSTGNDLVLMYDCQTKTWHSAPMAICAFGYWTGQVTYTIDTIPFATIDGITWPSIDWAGQVSEFPFVIASDYSGYGQTCLGSELDNGSAYTGRLVLYTDLAESRAVTEFKRVHGFWAIFAPGHGEVTIKMWGDNGVTWATVGTVTLDTDKPIVEEWLPCDFRFRHTYFKVEGANPFDFIGVIFDFDWDGDV